MSGQDKDGKSHPVWVCGLKQKHTDNGQGKKESHPVWVCGLKPHYAVGAAAG